MTHTCLGVACDVHARCARYKRVETHPDERRIGTCVTADGYPDFIEFFSNPAAAKGEMPPHRTFADAPALAAGGSLIPTEVAP